MVEGPAAARPRRVSVPARLDRRSLRLARPFRRAVFGDDAIFTQQSLCSVEGILGSPGARLPSHVWPADADDELLEQLRSAAVPREAHPADDRERARRQAAAGLRRW